MSEDDSPENPQGKFLICSGTICMSNILTRHIAERRDAVRMLGELLPVRFAVLACMLLTFVCNVFGFNELENPEMDVLSVQCSYETVLVYSGTIKDNVRISSAFNSSKHIEFQCVHIIPDSSLDWIVRTVDADLIGMRTRKSVDALHLSSGFFRTSLDCPDIMRIAVLHDCRISGLSVDEMLRELSTVFSPEEIWELYPEIEIIDG